MPKSIQPIKYSTAMRANPMKPEEPTKAYASVQLTGKVSLSQLAQHIHEHGSVYPRDTIIGVLTAIVDCTKEFVQQGFKVDLGDLGSFAPGIKSDGAKSLDSFDADNITDLRVRYTMSSYLKDIRIDAQFEKVASRKAQAAVFAAEIAGQENANWSEGQSGQ